MTTAVQGQAAPGVIEYHHIDYIPKVERHGKVRIKHLPNRKQKTVHGEIRKNVEPVIGVHR